MLEIDGLSARAGGFTLAGISLTITKGECHAVLGPSGSGKSSLLNTVLGTLPVHSGHIRLAGEEITHLAVEHRRLGYVPQQLGLFPHLSVRDNLSYSAHARKLPVTRFQPLLDRLVEITGIGALLDRRPATLSGGERQRVALVRALAADPSLVLLDEPFTALNESLRRELWWLVKELQRERALSVLLVTHDLAEAHFLAERITVLIDGRQEQSGEKRSIYRRPASEATARFLGIKNLFPAHVIDSGTVDCPALGGRVILSPPPQAGKRQEERIADQPGAQVWLAIRAEHVALRTPDDPMRENETRLAGRFEAVLDLGETALLHFRSGTGALLELRCGSRVLRKYGIETGNAGNVGLPAGDLFLLSR
ncbi:MAG: ABC transporter ATP-binding protein [Sulfurimicrobium sp.]